jgi:hypothetical protein
MIAPDTTGTVLCALPSGWALIKAQEGGKPVYRWRRFHVGGRPQPAAFEVLRSEGLL